MNIDNTNFPMTLKLRNQRISDKPPRPPQTPLKSLEETTKFKNLKSRI